MNLLLFLLVASFLQENTNAENCPDGWTLLNGHCYIYADGLKHSWDEANVWCYLRGAHLVVLETEQEMIDLRDMIVSEGIWLGCTDKQTESTWLCYNETLSDAIRWGTPPTNDTLHRDNCLIVRINNVLEDISCLSVRHFVCEAEPNELVSTSDVSTNCPPGWVRFNDTCYVMPTDRLHWELAELYCQSFGGNLLVFDTEEEVRAVNDSFDVADMWIGCSNREMDGTHYVCRWTNMTILPGWDEPPEDSVLGCTSFDNMLRAKTRLCSRKKTFICEAKLDKLTVDRFNNCPPGWVISNDKCYYYSLSKHNWQDAQAYCQKAVSDLVVFETAEERDVIRNLFQNRDVWIGCDNRDVTNQWTCYGTTTPYLDFGSSEPPVISSDSCLVMGVSGTFQEEDCTSALFNFICQMPKEQYRGCFRDHNRQSLAGYRTEFKIDNNLYDCTLACNSANYVMVGLRKSTQCNCGNEMYSFYGQLPAWECAQPCKGNIDQYCGDGSRQLVYHIDFHPDVVSREYTLSSKGKRLTDSSFLVFMTTSVTACADECTSNSRCLSFNYCSASPSPGNRPAMYTCELNYKTNLHDTVEESSQLCDFYQY
ncbi:secretory phospholipase A2 receptor-like [Apostichopus japonicus]|uniref:secretory phospholipase A2 receptor-like n=1 Tax=Stichopus japonicus TaxID=307972 RepID=UPI003AB118E7